MKVLHNMAICRYHKSGRKDVEHLCESHPPPCHPYPDAKKDLNLHRIPDDKTKEHAIICTARSYFLPAHSLGLDGVKVVQKGIPFPQEWTFAVFSPPEVAFPSAFSVLELQRLRAKLDAMKNDKGSESIDEVQSMPLQPYTKHHTPCTMHHTPYTIHHTPCTMHHAPYTLHHAPCTLHYAQEL